ncbi:MAG: hypothetical protein QNJ07_03275 [Woeseiaceae bacterium]|nr:hypothetical protein [Woeseiaceae bacterium]
METGWIQVFVLTLAECVAPAGKTVCQEQQFELQFLTRADCEYALEQLVTLKDASENVIVDRSRSRCVASAVEREIYASLDDVKGDGQATAIIRQAPRDATGVDETRGAHKERLDSLKTCEESGGVAPCKIGEIIIEEAQSPESVEVWRRD